MFSMLELETIQDMLAIAETACAAMTLNLLLTVMVAFRLFRDFQKTCIKIRHTALKSKQEHFELAREVKVLKRRLELVEEAEFQS